MSRPVTLRGASRGIVRYRRLFPTQGRVLVEVGQAVEARQVVVEALPLPSTAAVPVAEYLGIKPTQLGKRLLKELGEHVAKDEPIARKGGLFGGRKACRSPLEGIIGHIFEEDGVVQVQTIPRVQSLSAGVPGKVVEVIPQRGVVIELPAVMTEGFLVAGGEARGPLRRASQGPGEPLNPELEGVGDTVLLAGWIDAGSLQRAQAARVAGVVGGSVAVDALRWLASQQPYQGPAVMVTEGVGAAPMAEATWAALTEMEGQAGSLLPIVGNGQGTRLAQLIVPLPSAYGLAPLTPPTWEVGQTVRIVAGPHAGRWGQVVALPQQPLSGRVGKPIWAATVELRGGEAVPIPVENLELVG